jgi:DNA mismatch endonuclease (patch repair protein)
MRANRNVSRAEIRFRHALWAAGARGYRRGVGQPGRPDIVFPAVRVAIFVNGCYWHRCPTCGLPQPKANAEFWREKFDQNVDRDRIVAAVLGDAGWRVVTVWEHELRADVDAAARRVADLIEAERRRQ